MKKDTKDSFLCPFTFITMGLALIGFITAFIGIVNDDKGWFWQLLGTGVILVAAIMVFIRLIIEKSKTP